MSRPGHGRAPILLACLLTLLPAPAAVARESREAVGGGWNDAAAWTPRGVPGPADVATIPAGVGMAVDDTAPAVARQLVHHGELRVADGASLTLGDGPSRLRGLVRVDCAGSLRLGGTTTWAAGAIELRDGGTLDNAGGLFLIGDALEVRTGTGACLTPSTPRVRNLTGATLERLHAAGSARIDVPLHNAGAVEVDEGRLELPGGLAQSAGRTVVAAGARLVADVRLDAGLLGGSGTVEGDVANPAGVLAPGGARGVLTIGGDYAQGPGATLQADVAGAAAGTGHDQLAVQGDAALDGTLALTTASAYTPQAPTCSRS